MALPLLVLLLVLLDMDAGGSEGSASVCGTIGFAYTSMATMCPRVSALRALQFRLIARQHGFWKQDSFFFFWGGAESGVGVSRAEWVRVQIGGIGGGGRSGAEQGFLRTL